MSITGSTESYIFDRITKIMKYAISKRGFDLEKLPHIDFHIDDFVDKFVVTLKVNYMGKKLKGDFILNKPANWKEMFKEQNSKKWWMRWWIKRHPIKRVKIKLDVLKYVIFPEYRIPRGLENEPTIKYLEFRSLDDWKISPVDHDRWLQEQLMDP